MASQAAGIICASIGNDGFKLMSASIFSNCLLVAAEQIEGAEKLLKDSWELERKAYSPDQYHQLSPALSRVFLSFD
ncbi:MAG: hypothetical protein BA866_04835 [Desulfobulbaceae bacterium S5133MH15]|nr:MAG: hypothetical protein BA866_04835 [Desulfobulbaceae bacterium S5133MH15]OEU80794.1 MAG: hypothetical protein BA873_11485 [Desulfobulbaceae bacterium C00003063]